MLNSHPIRSKFLHIFKIIFLCFIFSLLYIPIFIIIYQSFNSTANAITPLSWGGFTLNNYKEIFTNSQLYKAILDSLLVSFWATFISTIFGLFTSIGINALGKKLRKGINFLNEIPLMNSEIVTGISLMLIFSLLKPIIPNIFGFFTMLIAHVFFTTPYVIMMILPKLEQMDESLYEASRDLGCSPLKALNKVIIPSLSTAILTGALIAFTLSIDDFVISFYTQGNGFSNISNYVYSSYTKKNFSAGVYAFNALFTFISLGFFFFISLKQSKKEKVR